MKEKKYADILIFNDLIKGYILSEVILVTIKRLELELPWVRTAFTASFWGQIGFYGFCPLFESDLFRICYEIHFSQYHSSMLLKPSSEVT